MKRLHDLLAMLDRASIEERSLELSLRVIMAMIGLTRSESQIWIEEFGDPLNSLAGAKATVDHLGFDWHKAMSAGAAALESKGPWLLPELAPRIIAWALRRMIEDGSGVDPELGTRH